MSKYFLILYLIFLCFLNSTFAQVRKDIIPMRSTCEDVKTIYKVETCKKSDEFYSLPNELVRIGYSNTECPLAYGKKWNIPLGTVISVEIVYKKLKKLSDFNLDTEKCDKTEVTSDALKEILYSCRDIGTKLNVVEDESNLFVSSVTYIPTLQDHQCLLCK